MADLFTPLEISRKMKVSRFTPYTWIELGWLKATNISQNGIKKARWIIREEDFEEFKSQHGSKVKKQKRNEAVNPSILQEFTEMKNKLLELAIMVEDLEKKLKKEV